MILKKPYAFLIKNFKIIHLILFVIISFVTIRFGKLVSFFSDYLNDNIKVTEHMAPEYISTSYIIGILLIIFFAVAMFLLMKKKKKPFTFYILTFVYYFIILIMVINAYSTIDSLYEAAMTMQKTRVYHDIYIILSLPNYYFLVMSLIRGIGFDIKKFNFSKDLNELEIKSEDNEEFEFVLGTDVYIYKRKIHRFFREAKYYFLENKYLFKIIGSVALGITIIVIIVNTNIFNKKYHVGDTTSIGSYQVTLNNSYITQKDYNGQVLKSNKKYVVVDLSIINNGVVASIDSKSIYLSYGSKKVFPKQTEGTNFLDIGKSYNGTVLANKKTYRYLFIFEIDNSVGSTTFNLNILKDFSIDKNNQYIFNYIKYKLRPIKIDTEINNEEKKENEVMYFNDKVYDNSSLNIKTIDIASSYEFKYNYCITDNNCKEYYDVVTLENPANQKMLIISYDLKLKDTALINNFIEANNKYEEFFNYIVKLRYNINGKSYTYDITAKINAKVDNKIFLTVPSAIVDAKDLNLLINTRTNHYYILIDNK
jgi:hypothetical protein